MTVVAVPPRERYIPVAVRRAVLARDGLICQLCGCAVVLAGGRRPDALHFDHVVEWSAGGPNTVENLRVACRTCNLSRGRPLGVVREQLRPDHAAVVERREHVARKRARRAQRLGDPTPADRARLEQLLAEVGALTARQRERI
jgi:hypothetical protein